MYSYLDISQIIGFPKSVVNPPRFGFYPKQRHMPAAKKKKKNAFALAYSVVILGDRPLCEK